MDKFGRKSEKKYDSLLSTKEDDIGAIFKLEMAPQRVPWLILKKGCGIKYNLDHNVDPVMKTFIYTSVVRDIVKTYLMDENYIDCIFRDKWFQLISKKLSQPVKEFPENWIDLEPTQIDKEALLWIEEVVETMVSNLADRNGLTLIQKFKNYSKKPLVADEESEEY